MFKQNECNKFSEPRSSLEYQHGLHSSPKGQHVEKTNFLQCATEPSLEIFLRHLLLPSLAINAQLIQGLPDKTFIVNAPSTLTAQALSDEHIKMEGADTKEFQPMSCEAHTFAL